MARSTMDESLVRSGYRANNIASIDKKFLCSICGLVFRNPVQLNCGHRICRLHLPQKESDISCPECSETTPIIQVKPDKGLINDMKTLHIECSLCKWSGHLKAYQSHLEQSHNQYLCSFCNQTLNSIVALEEHKQKTCLYVTTNCPLEPYGCKKQILRYHLPQHYLTEEHQQILLVLILQLIATVVKDNAQLTTMDLSNKTTTTTTTTISASSVTDESNIDQKSINETVEILNGGVKVLRDEVQQISDDSLQQSQLIERTDETATALKISHEESAAGLNALNTNFSIIQQSCVSLTQAVEENLCTSYDGTSMWRIMNVQEKMADAQSERQVSIYSPPFYSAPSGYKMCARLYLFGDGNARRTHLSLFFVLMRSVNDPILEFPFRHKVVFCLFDQSGQQRHIIDSFRPDTKSNSFQRPRSHMNIASGIPKFVPLSMIQQPDSPYIKNDTMFIKIMVDFVNIPKGVLPFAMSINPAIPTNIREKLIQQEIEKQTQMTNN